MNLTENQAKLETRELGNRLEANYPERRMKKQIMINMGKGLRGTKKSKKVFCTFNWSYRRKELGQRKKIGDIG